MNARVLLLAALLSLALLPTGTSQDLLEACDSDGDGEPDGFLVTPPGGGEPVCSSDATDPVDPCTDTDPATACPTDPATALLEEQVNGVLACVENNGGCVVDEAGPVLDAVCANDPSGASCDPAAVVAGCTADPTNPDTCPLAVDPAGLDETLCGPGGPFVGTPACDGVPDPTAALFPPPDVSVAGTANLLESEGQGTFTFTRADAATNVAAPDVTVRFTLGGTATRGTDFTTTGGTPPTTGDIWTIVVPADPGTATLFIAPVRDLVADDNETLIVTLQAATDGSYNVVTPSSATMNVDDVAPNTVTITASDAVATENSTTDVGRFTVARTGPLTEPLKVKLQAPSPAPGTPATYILTPNDGFVTIPAGAVSIDIEVRAVNDQATGGKSVTLGIADLVTPEGTAFPVPYLVGTPSAATVTIIDDDLPTVRVEVTDAAFNETESGAIRISRSGGDLTQPLTVAFGVTGTATRGTDYSITGPSGDSTVDFGANVTQRTLSFTPIQDTAREGTETAIVTLVPSGTYQVLATGANATLSLVDDDVPTVTVTPKTAATTEGLGTGAAWTFTRTKNGLVNELTVNFRLSGSATASDYTVATGSGVTFQQGEGTITFPANVRSINVTLTAIDDSLPEGNETVIATVVQAATNINYGVGTPGSATLTLVDNDILDADKDGIDDAKDNCLGLANASQADADADGKGNPCDPDDDNDGLTDTKEAEIGSNPLVTDTDKDGRGDGAEVNAGTNATNRFSPDYRANNVTADVTASGVQVSWRSPLGALTDRFLVFRASDPTLIKQVNATAGQSAYVFVDGAFPGGEHEYFVQAMLPTQTGSAFDAAAATSSGKLTASVCEVYPTDTDGDGLCDREEATRGTDPQLADSDGDGVSDKAEVDAGSDPTRALVPRSGASSLALGKEGPFWLGLVLAAGAAALLVVGVVMMRKRPGA